MLRHCTMNELLEIRDGGGSAAALAHVDECAACQDELDRLHQRVAMLKALPHVGAPRDRWPAIRDAVEAGRRQRWYQRLAFGGLAAAAALVMGLGLRALVPQANPVGDTMVDAADVETLMGESRQLEELLATVPRGRVLDGLTASAIADLEDRISLVDVGIDEARTVRATPEQVASLWRQRVALMDALVQVHVREVGYAGF